MCNLIVDTLYISTDLEAGPAPRELVRASVQLDANGFVQRDQIRNVVDVDVARRSAEANDVEDVGLHLDAGHGQVVAHRALDAVDLDLFGGADEADLVLLVVVGRQLAEQSVRLGLGALARSKCVSDLCG